MVGFFTGCETLILYLNLNIYRTSRLAACLFLLLWQFASAQSVSVAGGVNISYPLPGDVVQNGSTIYFAPGDIRIYEWRITVGASADAVGLFDSGVKNFERSPWEWAIDGIPNNGEPVTLRFWQRQQGGSWISTDVVYNTSTGASTATVTEQSSNTDASAASVTPTPVIAQNNGAVVTDLSAEHRHGQTFLTWVEVAGDAGYHVYRHTVPITESNIGQAQKLTGKWGPLDSNTSINRHAHGPVPTTYVINKLGQPLSESNGLFVHTPAGDGSSYYAVTAVVNGIESSVISTGENSLSTAVVESVAKPQPILTLSLNRGKGRVYTQFMDYANWNPTFNGYAYNYTVALPVRYRKSRSYPLLIQPHAYGENFRVIEEAEYGWQVIQLFPSDPGEAQGAVNSWWYGYAADHNYQTDGPVPTAGSIENFTEQRVMQAVQNVIDDPEINVDSQLVHAFGHSMGASGSLSLGMRYGNVIAGIYGSEGMTNYRTSPQFQEQFERLWGSQSSNLPIVNGGPHADGISGYQGTGVWDWMNHQQQLINRRGDEMAYLMLAQGKADDIIDWNTQGAPMARVFNAASIGYSSRFIADAGHSWLGFAAIVNPLFGLGNDIDFPWRYPLDMSFPAIQNASGSGPMSPGLAQTDDYNLNIEWATPHTRFARPIVDKPRLYEISLRSTTDDQTADITPRNTQQFRVRPGEQCAWTTSNNNKRRVIARGTVTADQDALVTIPQVLITYEGTRVTIDCG